MQKLCSFRPWNKSLPNCINNVNAVFRSIFVWFLSDSRSTPAKVPPSFLLKPRLISVKFPLNSLFSPQFPSLLHLLSLPFATIPLFPLPDKFPLYNIIRCTFPFPAFPFFLINYQNLPIPQLFTLPCKIYSKKYPFIFGSYHIIPYFCIRFPRDGQHLILTCCNGVGPALQNNKNNFLFIWIIIIKVVIFAVRFAERGPLVVSSFPFAQRGLEIKDGHWEKNFPKHLAV